jgi:PAS domain S-box-containing protein
LVDANPAASRLTGYSRDELLDQSFFALMPPECRPVVPEVFERLRADGVVQGEFRLRRKDGTMVVTDYRSSRVGPDRFRSVVRDVTERKRMGKTTAGDQPPLPGHASRAPTGLGLALVYGVVRRHGGTLSVASEVGNGTTVTMRLPIAPPVGKEPRPGTKPASAGYAHVLVVDDEPAMREIVAIYLATDGHAVETAANGRGAGDVSGRGV